MNLDINNSIPLLEIHPLQDDSALVVIFPPPVHEFLKTVNPDQFKFVRQSAIEAVTAAFDNFDKLKYCKDILDVVTGKPAQNQNDTDVH